MATKPLAKGKSVAGGQDRLAALRSKMKGMDLGGSSGFWTPKEGRNVIRILPEVGTMQYFFQQVGKHSFPPDGKKYAYCPNFTSEGELECPVCEIVSQMSKSGDKAQKAMANDLRVRRTWWMNVIVRGQESQGPMIFTPGTTIFGSLITLISDPDYGDITDLNEGFDITIVRKGSGLDTEYEVLPKPKPTPLTDDADLSQEWVDKAKDLSYVEVSEDPNEDKELSDGHALYVLPYNRIIKELKLDEGVSADEEEEKPSKSNNAKQAATAARNAKKPAPEPEPEEEDEDTEDDASEEDEEEEEVRPAKRSAVNSDVKSRMARRSARR
jgi:hypothetical protein